MAAADRPILRPGLVRDDQRQDTAKIAVNEAVELAKEFSTDRSPAFVNGLLDKVLKRLWRKQDTMRNRNQQDSKARETANGGEERGSATEEH